MVSDTGLAAVAWAATLLDDGATSLEVGAALRREVPDAGHAAAAAACAHARRAARAVHDDADRLVFTPSALEQASHPRVSAWRARRFEGVRTTVDLASGAGVDALAIAAAGPEVLAVDRDAGRTILLDHNRSVRGAAVRAVVGDALSPPAPRDLHVHADPSRRGARGRARFLAEYAPSVPELVATLDRSPGWAIVVSPGVDLDDPGLPDAELEFVQVGHELVEAVLWSGGLRRTGVLASATVITDDSVHTLTRTGDIEPLPVRAPADWLVEVAPAAVRARLHDEIAARVSGARVARRRALFTARDRPPDGPWLRSWRVEAVLPPRVRAVRDWLRTHVELPLEIAVHGLDVEPGRFWIGLGRPPRGPAGRRVHLVRLDDGAAAIITVGG